MSKNQFIDAIRELDARSDDNFADYCVPTEQIRKLASFDNKSLIAIGLKGIGKSAAFRYLVEIDDEVDVKIGAAVNAIEFNFPKVNHNCLRIAPLLRRNFSLFILSEIIRDKKAIGKVPPEILQKAETHVKNLFGKIKHYAGKIASLSALGFGFSLRASSADAGMELGHVDSVSESEVILREICESGLRVRLVLDDPDRLFSTSTEIDEHLVAAVCLAGYELSKKCRNLKIIPILKSHIYGCIMQIDEMNSLPADICLPLYWKREELQDVIEKRIIISKVDRSSVFVSGEFEPSDLSGDLYKFSRNGPRDCLRRIELCLKAGARQMVGEVELGITRKEYAYKCREQMTTVYKERYPNIFDMINALFSQEPTREYVQNRFRGDLRQLILNDQTLNELFKERWARNSESAYQALVESGSISFCGTEGRILPYEEMYYDTVVVSQSRFGIVPAFLLLFE